MLPRSRKMPCCFETPAAPKQLKDRNLAATDPKKEQFEPTPAAPIPQHARMAGAG